MPWAIVMHSMTRGCRGSQTLFSFPAIRLFLSTAASGTNTNADTGAFHQFPTLAIGSASEKEMPKGIESTLNLSAGTAGRCLSYGNAGRGMPTHFARDWKHFSNPYVSGQYAQRDLQRHPHHPAFPICSPPPTIKTEDPRGKPCRSLEKSHDDQD